LDGLQFVRLVYSDVSYLGLSLDYSLANLSAEEENTLTTYFLANLAKREQEIQDAACNLDTDVAAVWTHSFSVYHDHPAFMRLSAIFNGMKTRCYNENDPGYRLYGARGIQLYQWVKSHDGWANTERGFTGEDIRVALTTMVGNPNSPNAWGALIAFAIRRNVIEATGAYRKMKCVTSHARRTMVYTLCKQD